MKEVVATVICFAIVGATITRTVSIVYNPKVCPAIIASSRNLDGAR